VALRNAQLYHQVPMVDALGALAAKKQAVLALPRRRLAVYAALLLAVLAALTLIRWPYGVSGTGAAFRPTALAPVRAQVPGVIERVLVREGSTVVRGSPLASLRATHLLTDRTSTAAAIQAAERSAALAASRGDVAEERMQRIRTEALQRELALLDEEVELTTIRAPVSGRVLTPRIEELVGATLEEGDLVLTLGRTDTLELEFGVNQRDVAWVRPGQKTVLRVDALPQRTFVGRVTSVGHLPLDSISSGSSIQYPVRAAVANADGMLRPQMSAYTKVLTWPASTLDRVLRAPARWGRLTWWRLKP
jgi:multidrug resistance efflux pump